MLRRLFEIDNVILSPHLTFDTAEVMRRLEDEILDRRPVAVKSRDPRLR
ncbi:MAG: hypothetical protein V3R90_06805 [Limibaculum sp.]